MIEIKQIFKSEEKMSICSKILYSLPNWFGIESSIIEYSKEVQDLSFFVACIRNVPVGFIALKAHNKYTSEIYVIGVLEEYHRIGIGKQLIHHCQSYCCKRGNLFFTVKTLDTSRENAYYEKTRKFYYSMGFRPLEVFLSLWDESNPCLLMAKYIGNNDDKELSIGS